MSSVAETKQLPTGWKKLAIEDIAEVNPCLNKSEISDDLSVSFVPMPAVEAESGVIDVTQERPFAEVKKGFTPFMEGDVLFAKITPCMENGKMAVVPKVKNGYGFGSTEFHVLRPKAGIDSRYLYYFVSSKGFRNVAQHNMTGAVGQKRVPTNYLKQQLIPVAPLDEQKRIVAKIEELFSHIDAGIEGLKKTQRLLKQYRQAVLKAAVTGELTREWRAKETPPNLPLSGEEQESIPSQSPSFLFDIPDEWCWVRIEQLGDVTGGLTKNKKREQFELKLPYLRVANVYANELRLDDISSIGVQPNELKRVLLEKDDLLMVEGNGSPDQIGRLAVWNGEIEPCIHQNHLIKIRLKIKDSACYLMYWLSSLAGRAVITQVASSTSGLYTLSISKVTGLPVPLPPLEEQKEICKIVGSKLDAIGRLEREIDAQLVRAERNKQSILVTAFSGNLH